MEIFIILLLIFILYIYSQRHMRVACIKMLKQLVVKKQMSEDEFNSISEKVYSNNNNNNNNNNNLLLEESSKKETIVKNKVSAEEIAERKEKIRQNNVSSLLYLGVTLILIAGIVFATTTWDYLPGTIKAILLFGFSGMLFLASKVSSKKLKLEKTSFALWILGSLFLPITCICAGYLNVFGSYFSLNSEGKYLFSLFSTLVCLPIYIISAKKYLSKVFSYIAAINATLIAYFTFLNISDKIDILLILMSIYNLVSLVIFTNIIGKSKFRVNISKAMNVVSKITLIITTAVTFLIINTDYKIDIALLINYLIIIANYKYICTTEKSYSFSIATAVTTIALFSSTYMYMLQNNIFNNFEYTSFMFIVMAIVCALIQGVGINYIANKKFNGLKLLMNVTSVIFILILAIISISKVLDISNKYIEVLVFSIITLMLLIQTQINYKKIRTIFNEIIELCICIFSVLIPFALYRYLPVNLNINLIVYISVIFMIPWLISKIKYCMNNNNKTLSTYRFVGTLFLLIPFMCSFIEINPQIAIYKFLIAILLIVISVINYIDYLSINKRKATWDLALLNISYLTLIAPIFIILTAWLNIIPIYFTTFIAATLIYLFSTIDSTGKLLEKSKIYILVMVIISNIIMFVNITGILEYIFMQSMLILIFCNKTFRKFTFYNIYFLCALFLNTLAINSLPNMTKEIFNIFNILILLIVSCINIYNYYELRSNKTGNENLIIQKFMVSFGLLIGLIPYVYIVTYIVNLFNLPVVMNMIFIQIPIIFVVFSIEKIIYKMKNIFTYIVEALVYFAATVTLFGFNDILIYSIMLIILVIIGSYIKNKSIFVMSSIFLIIFVIKGTSEFWLNVPWWLYLLIGGGTLVYVAMKRESNKQKNIEDNKLDKIKQFLSNYED